MITEQEHAPLSASSAAMNMACLASLIPLDPPMPDVETEHSKEGTLFHDYMRQVTLAPTQSERDSIISSIPKDDMKQHVITAYKHDEKIKEAIGHRLITQELTETKVKFSDYMWGTLDRGFLYIKQKEKRLYLKDYKYGVWPVDVAHNLQQIVYALATKKTHNWDFKQATLSIYQPRAKDLEEGQSGFKQWTLTLPDIKLYTSKLKAFEKKALKVLDGSVTPKEVTGSHCHFCPRKQHNQCSTYREQSRVPGVIELSSLNPLPSITPEVVTVLTAKRKRGEATPPVSLNFTDEQCAAIAEKEDLIISILKANRSYMTKRALMPGGFPGYKLVQGRSQRSIIPNKELAAEELKKLKPDLDPYKKVFKGLGDLERELGDELPDSVTIRSTPSLKLVSEADPRPAVAGISLSALTPPILDGVEDDTDN